MEMKDGIDAAVIEFANTAIGSNPAAKLSAEEQGLLTKAAEGVSDTINPQHYKRGGLEAIDVIEAFGCDFLDGNAVKYLLRWRRKNGVEDLRKAAWYIDRLIKREDRSR